MSLVRSTAEESHEQAVANSPALPEVEQQELFADDMQVPRTPGTAPRSWRKIVGITYRQLDYWARTAS